MKQANKLHKAFRTLMSNSVDKYGNAKKATPTQLYHAIKALHTYEDYIKTL